MTRRLKGTAAALLALLLVLGGAADAAGAHHCPHHDGPASHARSGNSSHHEHDPGADSDSHGPCTCVGQCHAGTTPSLPAPVLDRDVPVPAAPPLSFRAPQPPVRVAIVPFSLPWGNAPPSL